MQSKSILRRIIVSFLGLITSISIAMGPMGNMGGMGMPSLEDIQAMEAEIDKFVRSLPPEQQKQFYKDVEELTNIMEKMTPDELNDFVGSVFTDAGLIEQPAPAKPAPKAEPVKPKEEAKPAIKVTTAPAAPTEKAVNMINSIIKRTEEFMRKAQVIQELQAKMNKWVVQKKLLDVAANLDWQTVETQIDDLNVLLYSLIELDPITKQYKHIGNLIKDEALYNNLATLQVTLDAYVPGVEIPPFGLETVSKESRAAIREVLSQYLEAFYLLNIPAAIKKVKALYEPRAKELKEEEKQRAEQAYKEAQKTRTPAPAVRSPGTKAPYTPAPYTPPSRPDYTPAPYYPAGYTPAEPSRSLAESWPSAGSTKEGNPSAGSPAQKAAGKESEKGKEAKGGAPAGKEETFGEEVSGAPSEKATKKGLDLGHEISMIAYDVRNSMKKLKAFGDEFKSFGTQFYTQSGQSAPDAATDAKSLEDLKKRVAVIQEVNTSLQEATSDIKKFKDKVKGSAEQEEYKKLIASDLADAIKYYEAIRKSVDEFKVVAEQHKGNLPNKTYIYFNEGKPSDAVKQAIPKVPVTMDAFIKTIDEFIKAAK